MIDLLTKAFSDRIVPLFAMIGLIISLLVLYLTIAMSNQLINASIVETTQYSNFSITRALVNELYPELKPILLLETRDADNLMSDNELATANQRITNFMRNTDILKIKVFS